MEDCDGDKIEKELNDPDDKLEFIQDFIDREKLRTRYWGISLTN